MAREKIGWHKSKKGTVSFHLSTYKRKGKFFISVCRTEGWRHALLSFVSFLFHNNVQRDANTQIMRWQRRVWDVRKLKPKERKKERKNVGRGNHHD